MGAGLKIGRRAALLVLIAVPLMADKAPPATVVTGAGSTFVTPILTRWTTDYMADFHISGGTKIAYQSVGSGAGIEAIKAHKVDFGASDKPLPPAELRQANLAQFPLVIGGVVPVVNIPGIRPGQLRFTGAVLADIYQGTITRWNDPAIVRINPGAKLPDAPITVVHRSDGSGTTFNWVDFLSKKNPRWKATVGEGTTVKWPVGVGGNGNEGVTAAIKSTANSIGYVELAYVAREHLAWASVQNRAGRFIAPSQASFQAAAAGAAWDPKQDFYLVLTDAPGVDAYPITATTFVLVPRHINDFTRTRALLQLFEYALFKGQPQATALGYVPLPQKLAARVALYWTTEVQH
ncbi:phosphate ABC transporter substrate-binding protein PstS [Flavisphingomonas formosensis]|uniref:phosphate ABC transporter substrate-binding protein PstS n=1 Tax=Flavisphingomonas formosensis TaxID=861534 RepID=UPI0012F8A161|nr:phosphate ABC transporter substrate-binding protein PstS [Sphingomonas formosensis]